MSDLGYLDILDLGYLFAALPAHLQNHGQLQCSLDNIQVSCLLASAAQHVYHVSLLGCISAVDYEVGPSYLAHVNSDCIGNES